MTIKKTWPQGYASRGFLGKLAEDTDLEVSVLQRMAEGILESLVNYTRSNRKVYVDDPDSPQPFQFQLPVLLQMNVVGYTSKTPKGDYTCPVCGCTRTTHLSPEPSILRHEDPEAGTPTIFTYKLICKACNSVSPYGGHITDFYAPPPKPENTSGLSVEEGSKNVVDLEDHCIPLVPLPEGLKVCDVNGKIFKGYKK